MSGLSDTCDFKVPELEDSKYVSTNQTYSWGRDKMTVVFIPETSVRLGTLGRNSIKNEEIINQIKSFRFLQKNWDDDNAKIIPLKSIYNSIKIVQELNIYDIDVYFSSPGPNEEILLLLKNNLRELEIIVYPNKQKFVKFEDQEFIEQGDFNHERLPLLVTWLK